MYLPPQVEYCIGRLEQAGFPAYAVGGCVRDACLGLQPQDYDLCTAALPEEICELFSRHSLVTNGQKHGTIGVVVDRNVYEITTFRTEGSYSDSRHPDWVRFVPAVEEDLARRDFTVNAMAYSPTRGFADPFGGRQDLQNGILRAVGPPQLRFTEDALRILRGVRFAAKYRLEPENETLQAMLSLAPRLENVAAERIFDELCKLLPLAQWQHFCMFAPILTQVIPELAPCVGFDQRNRHHLYDIYRHSGHVVEAVPETLSLRWAALLHDIGKPATFSLDAAGNGHFYGHDKESAQMADGILRRLKAPNALRQQAVQLIELHMTKIEPEKKVVRRWLGRLGQETMEQLLLLQEADMGSKGTGTPSEISQFDQIRQILQQILAENACFSLKDLAVNGHDLMALGITGRQIGRTLQHLLEQVMEDALPNEKTALLAAAAAQTQNQE